MSEPALAKRPRLAGHRISRQVIILRAFAVLAGCVGSVVFLAIDHSAAAFGLGGAAIFGSLLSGFAPGSSVVTVSLLLFAGQVAATADARSQGMVLVLAMVGAAFLWAEHSLWAVVNAVPADSVIQQGAFRAVVPHAISLLAVALLVDLLTLSAVDVADAGPGWRWAGLGGVGLLFVAATLITLRPRRSASGG